MLERWFPNGQTDPDVALLEIAADTADVWDADRGAMVRVFEKLKAVTSGEMPPRPDHEHVDIRR